MPQKKPIKVLAGLGEHLRCRCPGPNEIAHRFMRGIRDPYRGKLAGAMQLGQHDGVAPIGLDPVAGFDRDQRRGNHHTSVPEPADKPVKTVAARSSFVTEAQLAATSRQSLDQLAQHVSAIGKAAQLPHLP